ncbi:hypothetical protein M2371_002189 [Buttiauxella sp. BIGb0471]|uniref:GapS1 family protein n=1 Tax=Buttiauxella sp. BIGb0471 TaxID=2940597 RepID=UPI002168B58C|nr:hypothetical protein [Buttiauxella sp. BIGb0471]MCS3602966.1 hypothetical protein [Buttiauxella sp. BIGb0471]
MNKYLNIQSDAVAKLRMDAVRAEIQGFQPELFIEYCMQYNLRKFDDQLDMLKHMPWVVNLCLKWSASVIGKRKNFKALSKQQAIILFQKAYNTLSIIPLGLERKNGIDFFLRNNIYQQGIYQRLDALNTISRQVFIFSALEDNHRIKRKFFEITQVSIDDFLKLSYILISHITTSEPVRKLNATTFEILYPIIPREIINNFLDAISINYNKLAAFSKAKTHDKPLLEYYSSSPYLESPLIKINMDYYQIHTQITSTSIQTFIYDLLRRNDAETFMTTFGNVFENALKKIINECDITYYNEDYLKEKLPKNNKIVDFLIPHEEANIFIDAKGVEIHQKGMVTLRPEDIAGKIKTSVLKAIEQSHEVNREIKKDSALITQFRSESYIICITYKNLFLGNGSFLAKTYAKDEIIKIYNKFNNGYHIPPENIFCLAFEEFEYLIESCRHEKTPPHLVLRFAANSNKTPSSAAFLFAHHIRNYFDKVIPSEIVNQAGLKVVNSIIEKLK